MNRFFALVLVTTFISFGGRAALAAPIFSFDINGTAIDPAALNCAAVGNQTVCGGTNLVENGYELNSWEFLLDPDPSVIGSFTLTNLSGTTQTFSVSATLGVLPIGQPLSMSGYVGAGTLTDVNGLGATLTDVGLSLYAAMVDGAAVRTLLDPPQSYSVASGPSGGPGVPLTIPFVSFGPEALAQSINSSIGTSFPGFSLTGGDSVQFPFGFDATPATVPEPGSVMLLGSGLAALAFSRRRPEGYAEDSPAR